MISYHITYLHICSYTYRYFVQQKVRYIPFHYLPVLGSNPTASPKATSLDQSISAIAEAMTGQANQQKLEMGAGSQVPSQV